MLVRYVVDVQMKLTGLSEIKYLFNDSFEFDLLLTPA